ncbi:hypothetical protein EPI10_006229 [Gossypium australe]|uniref:Uncharacterized protein n=1 Tax=Gossypium australe TaxID=47621 RepID=A0A5B6WSM4_9ROSI|nr:hypothetical protein EPI10_006229 [Gossypium australe]
MKSTLAKTRCFKEDTWEPEEAMRKQYPNLFIDQEKRNSDLDGENELLSNRLLSSLSHSSRSLLSNSAWPPQTPPRLQIREARYYLRN